jgi:hypothetical protein
MSESVGSSEFLLGIEEYLRYLKHDRQADSVHTLSRTMSQADQKNASVKAFLQDLGGEIQDVQRNLADLIHGTVQADENVEIYKSILQFVGTGIEPSKFLSDLIHNVLKSEDMISSYKALLQFVSKTIIDNKSMADLASAIQRAIDSESFEDDFIKAHLSALDRQFLNDKIFRGINNLLKSDADRGPINDAFSRSQIKSKLWLMEELANIDTNYDNVTIMAGWFGQLKAIYEKKCTYAKMRIVEVDKSACETSDYIFNLSNLENYKVKSVFADINNLTLHKNGYEWEVRNFREETGYNEKFLPNLIINTSAEHMSEEWYNQIRFKNIESNPIVAIQSNNLFDIPEHINCVHSVDHMKKKFPMREILFEGELQLKGYKRVMLIGRP